MSSKRLLSLDILRGGTIIGMILVNNPGSWEYIYSPLRHAEWHGLTPTDLIFPFFIFVMGISMSLSFSKFKNEEYNKTLFWEKVIKRSAKLFLLGLFLSWFSLLLEGINNRLEYESISEILFPFGQIRILGVMQRLALSYLVGSVFVMLIPKAKHLVITSVILLIAYFILLSLGNGFSFSSDNIIAIVDNSLFGENHVYLEWLPDGERLRFDPEGLLSAIPCIVQVIMGYLCGEVIRKKKDLLNKMMDLAIIGIVLLFIGLLLSYGCPLNKKIWSPTFELVTSGFAVLALTLLIWIIDYKGLKKWCNPFEAFGTNPLFIYIASSAFASVLGTLTIKDISLQEYLYNAILGVIHNPHLASLIYALLYILLCYYIVNILFRKKIYIKI